MSKLTFGLSVLGHLLLPKIVKANIAVTWRCDHRCQMCSIWESSNNQKIENELTAPDIHRLIRTNGLIWVSLTGGEPFLNREIDDIIATTTDLCQMVSVNTNGSMPDRILNAVKKASKHAILVVSVSLEGDQPIHDQIVGVSGSYDKALETIKRLSSLNQPNLYVNIEHVLSNRTNKQYHHIARVAFELGVDVTYTSEQLSPYYHNTGKELINHYEIPEVNSANSSIGLFQSMYLSKIGHKFPCVAGEYSVFIDPYLNVYPCLLRAPENKLFSLRDTYFEIGKLKLNGMINGCRCLTPCETYTTALFRPWRLI